MSENKDDENENSTANAATDMAVGVGKNLIPGASVMEGALSAFANLNTPTRKVQEPNMDNFKAAMVKIKPIIDEKIMANELFQPPEKENNDFQSDKTDSSTSNSAVKGKSSDINYSCKQTAGNSLELEKTRLKECIESKLDCKHMKELIVKNFEKFIDKKVVHTHFHSVSKKTNHLHTASIFYRHGLSKIVSKIMDDVKNKPEILKFFLDEMMDTIETMQDEKLMEYIYGFDKDLIFELVNDENIKKLADENAKNKDKMCRLLLELYPESEFNILINDLMVNKQITREDMEKWRKLYDDFQLKEKIKDEINRKDENALLEKVGVDSALELFGLTPKKNELSKMHTEFVNEFTKYDEKIGGKKKKMIQRKTIKRKTPSK